MSILETSQAGSSYSFVRGSGSGICRYLGEENFMVLAEHLWVHVRQTDSIP